MSGRAPVPAADKLFFEREMLPLGAEYVAGADEAGRGPLAGPVVCAAVILPLDRGALIDGIPAFITGCLMMFANILLSRKYSLLTAQIHFTHHICL